MEFSADPFIRKSRSILRRWRRFSARAQVSRGSCCSLAVLPLEFVEGVKFFVGPIGKLAVVVPVILVVHLLGGLLGILSKFVQ